MTRVLQSVAISVADLVVARRCAGCAAVQAVLCPDCQRELSGPPHRVLPPVRAGCAVFALADYRGAVRSVILAAKVEGRRDLHAPLGALLAAGVHRLVRTGQIPDPQLCAAPLVLVPAPTARRAAARRGGDVVGAWGRRAVSHLPEVWRAQCVSAVGKAREVDLAGLPRQQRAAVMEDLLVVHRVPPHPAVVVLIDDVVTTGATVRATVRALERVGVDCAAVVSVAAVR